MPHCIVEYSNSPVIAENINELLTSVFKGAIDSQLFDAPSVKTRAIAFDSYQVGDTDKLFVHVTAKILSGRTLEQRQRLSKSIINSLSSFNFDNTSYTVEVIEMERESYEKHVS